MLSWNGEMAYASERLMLIADSNRIILEES